VVSLTDRQQDLPRFWESLWRMGGTLIGDECHIFDMEICISKQKNSILPEI